MLEYEKNNKGLSLDPQRSNLSPHFTLQFQQDRLFNSRYVRQQQQQNQGQEEEEEEEQQQEQYFHHLPFLLPQSQHLETQNSSKKRSLLSSEYAAKMGETHRQPNSSRNAAGVGEIVEVQGGHIVRSTGRKDRHSKVCTAKGPRDRRVRLAAHTAIQFYDVQDRLGYDRPSKAVDWLIKKAKTAIDELAELPAWTPTATAAKSSAQRDQISDGNDFNLPVGNDTVPLKTEIEQNPSGNSSFLPPSLDSDAIADTIKSFFPMCASVEASSAAIQLESYPPDLLSRTSRQNQDLRLSLQSFQEPILLQQHQHQHQHQQNAQSEHHAPAMFAGNGNQGFYAGWSEHHQHHPAEINRFQRMPSWNAGGAADTGSHGAGGFVFNSSLPAPPLYGQSQLFSQRGPLQSSNTPSIRAWIDPAIASDHHLQNFPKLHHAPPAMAGIGFSGGLFGSRVPARIHGNEEEHVHGVIHCKPTSASSNSRH